MSNAFKQALLGYEGKLSVFSPAPPEMLPLDIIGPEEVEALLGLATQWFRHRGRATCPITSPW